MASRRRRVLLAGLVIAFFASVAVAAADPTPTPAECYTSCAATYSKCTQACKPGDVACYAQCTTTYQQECLPKCGMPAPPSPPSPPSPSSPPSPPSPMTMTVKGVRECLKECKAKGKEANDKCKAEKWIKRGDCYAKVPNMVKACESGCNRKPHGFASAPVASDWYRDPCSARCAGDRDRCQAAFPDGPGCASQFGYCFMYQCQVQALNGDADLPCYTDCYANFQGQIPACQVGDMACFSKLAQAYQHCAYACPQPAWMPKCTTC